MHHPLLTLTQSATPTAAIALQQELRTLVVMEDDFGEVKTVAGVDVGFEEDDRIACAAIAVLQFPALTLQESVVIRRPTAFPYVPGLLAFRDVIYLAVVAQWILITSSQQRTSPCLQSQQSPD